MSFHFTFRTGGIFPVKGFAFNPLFLCAGLILRVNNFQHSLYTFRVSVVSYSHFDFVTHLHFSCLLHNAHAQGNL